MKRHRFALGVRDRPLADCLLRPYTCDVHIHVQIRYHTTHVGRLIKSDIWVFCHRKITLGGHLGFLVASETRGSFFGVFVMFTGLRHFLHLWKINKNFRLNTARKLQNHFENWIHRTLSQNSPYYDDVSDNNSVSSCVDNGCRRSEWVVHHVFLLGNLATNVFQH